MNLGLIHRNKYILLLSGERFSYPSSCHSFQIQQMIFEVIDLRRKGPFARIDFTSFG